MRHVAAELLPPQPPPRFPRNGNQHNAVARRSRQLSVMARTVADTVDSILERVEGRVEDPDLAFDVRTARQLVVLLGEELDLAHEAIDDADIDEDLREDLRDLGYLD